MEFTQDQKLALGAMKKRENIFLTGVAGTGKSTIIKEYIYYCAMLNIPVGVTALTGIAALNIHGMTLHKWTGIKLGKDEGDKLVQLVRSNTKAYERWRSSAVLIVDEVSMMSSELFEKLDMVGSIIRENTLPFGGLQLIFIGDFGQLPPVKSEELCFESPLWKRAIHKTVLLSKVVRQNGQHFINALNEIRLGICTKETSALLQSRMIKPQNSLNIKPTTLYSTRKDVSIQNMKKLNSLVKKGNQLFEYNADIEFTKKTKFGGINKEYLEDIVFKNCIAEKCLQICKGAQVMVNYNLTETCVNGSRGIVAGFDEGSGYPIVQLLNGEKTIVEPNSWEFNEDRVKIVVTQIPLILAYALTIHKCQGSTLDYVEIDIGDKIFEYGQAYTALSRAKNIDGLFIKSFNRTSIIANPKIIEFYKNI